ncbi:MAG: 4a-hydroxytetrahydrobiopterin dehydratase [Gammaproteobacteria bacterium]|nr:4a-hydroxytetrahydrobiopterin dehydratase [Gammaproteobacteria bacterium]
MNPIPPGWQERQRPGRLERRYLFEDYQQLRDFLDRAAALSEQHSLYPDMGFGRDYVNITIHADAEDGQLGDLHRQFAQWLDDLGGYKTTP